MSDEEMDQFFKELQMKNDLDNFIHYNQYPSSLKKTTQQEIDNLKLQYPVIIDENNENTVSYNKDYYTETANAIQKSLVKCDETIKRMTLTTPDAGTCPVCMCEFEESNYVIPRCKHKVCAVCFTNNIKHNKHTGDCCVLCRERIC
jgi:hypothetical protein